MGSYTNTLKFYKPIADEVVDVEQQLNYNWDINDREMKRLLEYEYVSGQNPNVVGALSRSRFYKEYSNTIQTYFKSTPDFFWQDPSAFASAWVDADQFIQGGYSSHPNYPPAYRIIKKSGGTTAEVEWTGAFWLDMSPMDLNVNVQFCGVDELPVAIRPTTNKYFNMWGGNTSTDFSVARLFIGANGSMEFKRYGVDPGANTAENHLDFAGIVYNVEVTG